jgi:predicted GNAT family acetyltransferase
MNNTSKYPSHGWLPSSSYLAGTLHLVGQLLTLANFITVRFDAFTHKSTAQYSLAFEKASIIFNISAVLSCHAAAQDRGEESALKTAYHNFQASAGMFTYINENFLHAPSSDLSRETVKALIHVMLAQAQEVFLEKQVTDKKKPALLAKLASQAGYLYSQALEGVQENVTKAIFEKVWLLMIQVNRPAIKSSIVKLTLPDQKQSSQLYGTILPSSSG